MVEELTDTDEMQARLHYILQKKFGNNSDKKLEGGSDHGKKFDKKSQKKFELEGGSDHGKKFDKKSQKKFELEGGSEDKKSVDGHDHKKSSLSLEGGKRKKASKKASKKTSKKTSKKASKKSSLSLEGGKRRKASKKTSKKTSKKASKKSSKHTVKREVNPYMMARSALIKVMFAKAKSKEIKLTIPDSAKIIKKIEEEVIQKHKLTDKVEILKKALEFFNSNVDKYLKV